jgi:DNA-binding response OmpR family regulator
MNGGTCCEHSVTTLYDLLGCNVFSRGGAQLHKILTVDDDEATLNLMRTRLSEVYEVICTMDPEKALGLALEHKPDAVLLDLMMPKFSGFELCQSLRSLSYTSAIPIIVITANWMRNTRNTAQIWVP